MSNRPPVAKDRRKFNPGDRRPAEPQSHLDWQIDQDVADQAVLTVCRNAQDVDDAQELLRMLGIFPGDEDKMLLYR